jgi:hypothetical protein
VVCATMWGRTAAATSWVEGHLAPIDCDAVMQGTPQPNPKASEAYDALIAAASFPVPFTFLEPAD